MALHRVRSRVTSALLALALALATSVVALTVGAGAASAALGDKQVKPKNSAVVGSCKFGVTSVNPSDGTAATKISVQGQPASLSGYFTNVYTQVACYVFDAGNNLVAYTAPFANGPTLPSQSTRPNIAFSSHYTLCGQALVKFANGGQSLTSLVCA